MKLNVLRADPAGNITLFVLDPIEKERRAALAAELMRQLPDMKIEQVGFACPADADTDGRMEMMGGEFCGNATRAYAMYVAQQRGGLSEVKLRVSGCDHVVTAAVDLAQGTARAEMPLPRAVRAAEVNGRAGTLVDLAGIHPKRGLLPLCRAAFCRHRRAGRLRRHFPRPHEPPHDAARQGRGHRHPRLGGELRQRHHCLRRRREREPRKRPL